MANIVYSLIILIFVFGASCTLLNESGLYTYKLPTSGVGYNTSQAQEMNTALVSSASSEGNGFGLTSLLIVGKIVVGGITAIFTLGPLLKSFGAPDTIVIWALSPLGIVLVFWVVEYWLQRYQE